jgi:hypothetical protein
MSPAEKGLFRLLPSETVEADCSLVNGGSSVELPEQLPHLTVNDSTEGVGEGGAVYSRPD